MDTGGPTEAELAVYEYQRSHPQIIHQVMDEFSLLNWCLWAFDKGKGEMTRQDFINDFKKKYR